MKCKVGLWVLIVILLNLIPLSGANAQKEQKDWAVTLYFGKLTDSDLTRTATFNFEFEHAYFVDVGLSRRLFTYRDYFNIEVEGQVAKHFGDQHHWEFDLIPTFRWLLFPWNKYVDTSFAAGVGLSYATSIPKIEAKHYKETSRFLGALRFEFAFSLPDTPRWNLVTGIHHRSGAGGTFNDVRGASNAWDLGLRYHF